MNTIGFYCHCWTQKAMGLFIDRAFVHWNGLKTWTLGPTDQSLQCGLACSIRKDQSQRKITHDLPQGSQRESCVWSVWLGKVCSGSWTPPGYRKHNPEIDWQTGEVKNVLMFTRVQCVDQGCNKGKESGEKLAEKVEVQGKHSRRSERWGGVLSERGGTMIEDDGVLEEIVEEVFIWHMEKQNEAMLGLCQDSDDGDSDDKDDIRTLHSPPLFPIGFLLDSYIPCGFPCGFHSNPMCSQESQLRS